ncbi:hypothetical protein LXL04_019498 [Taraxacum kok-saghyz]
MYHSSYLTRFMVNSRGVNEPSRARIPPSSARARLSCCRLELELGSFKVWYPSSSSAREKCKKLELGSARLDVNMKEDEGKVMQPLPLIDHLLIEYRVKVSLKTIIIKQVHGFTRLIKGKMRYMFKIHKMSPRLVTAFSPRYIIAAISYALAASSWVAENINLSQTQVSNNPNNIILVLEYYCISVLAINIRVRMSTYQKFPVSSKNRVAGTLETKPILSVTKEVTRTWLIEKVLPDIRAKWPQSQVGPIFIQQDNAKPHIDVNDSEFLEAASRDGFDIRLTFQPPNSPDLNVLDLGFFRAIQSLQEQEVLGTIDELVNAVQTSFERMQSQQLNNVFLTLQTCMKEIIKVRGDNNYQIPHIGKNRLEREDLNEQTLFSLLFAILIPGFFIPQMSFKSSVNRHDKLNLHSTRNQTCAIPDLKNWIKIDLICHYMCGGSEAYRTHQMYHHQERKISGCSFDSVGVRRVRQRDLVKIGEAKSPSGNKHQTPIERSLIQGTKQSSERHIFQKAKEYVFNGGGTGGIEESVERKVEGGGSDCGAV